jgi:hypothetical protein
MVASRQSRSGTVRSQSRDAIWVDTVKRGSIGDSGSINYQPAFNISREKSSCVIHSILQCSSSRLPETSGRFESAITIALLPKSMAIWLSGFWIGTHQEYNNFTKQLR